MIAELAQHTAPGAPSPFDEPAEQGLTATQAARRLAEVGPNELHRDEGTPPWRFLLGQFKSPMVLLLLGAAVVSGVLREAADAVAIGAIVVINAIELQYDFFRVRLKQA